MFVSKPTIVVACLLLLLGQLCFQTCWDSSVSKRPQQTFVVGTALFPNRPNRPLLLGQFSFQANNCCWGILLPSIQLFLGQLPKTPVSGVPPQLIPASPVQRAGTPEHTCTSLMPPLAHPPSLPSSGGHPLNSPPPPVCTSRTHPHLRSSGRNPSTQPGRHRSTPLPLDSSLPPS